MNTETIACGRFKANWTFFRANLKCVVKSGPFWEDTNVIILWPVCIEYSILLDLPMSCHSFNPLTSRDAITCIVIWPEVYFQDTTPDIENIFCDWSILRLKDTARRKILVQTKQNWLDFFRSHYTYFQWLWFYFMLYCRIMAIQNSEQMKWNPLPADGVK